MLYMFSGPDFLYATSFFPNASTYVLAGLEPVGSVPDLTSLDPSVIDGELKSLEASMSSLFSFSFFITRKMKTELREGEVYGTLPILYVFLARTSKTIHEVNWVRMDQQGNLQSADDWVRPTVEPTGQDERHMCAQPPVDDVNTYRGGPSATSFSRSSSRYSCTNRSFTSSTFATLCFEPPELWLAK